MPLVLSLTKGQDRLTCLSHEMSSPLFPEPYSGHTFFCLNLDSYDCCDFLDSEQQREPEIKEIKEITHIIVQTELK